MVMSHYQNAGQNDNLLIANESFENAMPLLGSQPKNFGVTLVFVCRLLKKCPLSLNLTAIIVLLKSILTWIHSDN
jgi:hypothetical protein